VTNCDDHSLTLPAPDDGCNYNLFDYLLKILGKPEVSVAIQGKDWS
jgi:hypothetical protein